jgi:hypothetical protein
MKSFNEFVSIKESMLAMGKEDTFKMAQAAAMKSTALKQALNISNQIDGILQRFSNTMLATLREYNGKMQHALTILIKDSSKAKDVYSEHGNPLWLAEKMSKHADAMTPHGFDHISNGERMVVDLMSLTAKLLSVLRDVLA